MSRAEDSLVSCEYCGQIHRWRQVGIGAVLKCSRCQAVLGRGHRLGFETVLALTAASLVVYLIAVSADVISVRLRGAVVSATIVDAVAAAWNDGQRLVAMAAAATALVAPAFFIGLRLYVLVPLAMGRRPAGFALCVRGLHHAARWNMVEVFTVGALLSLVRLAGLAEAAPGMALFALGVLTMLFAAIESAGLKHLWWHMP